MKSKEQALAMADALTAPAAAKRRKRVESRQQRMFGPSQALRAIPEADRPSVLKAAQRYASRRWYLYAPYAVVAIWLFGSWLQPQLLGSGQGSKVLIWMAAFAVAISTMLQRQVIRSYIKREAAKYCSSAGHSQSSTNV